MYYNHKFDYMACIRHEQTINLVLCMKQYFHAQLLSRHHLFIAVAPMPPSSELEMSQGRGPIKAFVMEVRIKVLLSCLPVLWKIVF